MTEFIKSKEKKEMQEKLNQQFGIKEIPFLLVKSGKEKLRAFSGSLSKDEISELANLARVENIGLYFAAIHEDGIRLSLDACHLLQNQISKNIIQLDDKQSLNWFKGNDLEFESKIKGFAILKHEDDIIGVGKASGNSIKNFLPKERRIKN